MARHSRISPAFAPSTDGDDIDAARAFVDLAVDGMRTLRADDTDAVRSWLDCVELAAVPLCARAVLRAVDAARAARGDALNSALATVGALVAQYEGGLADVEAQIESGERPLPGPVLGDADTGLSRSATPSDADRFEEARLILASLLPRADVGSHRDALERLMAFQPTGSATDAAATAGPVLSGTVDVEALLPGLADCAARQARLHGKAATVSFASESALLDAASVDEWHGAVETALLALCETTLESPRERRGRGLSGTSHIDMLARGVEGGVELSVRCPGARLPQLAVDAPHTLDVRREDERVTLVFTALGGARSSSAA